MRVGRGEGLDLDRRRMIAPIRSLQPSSFEARGLKRSVATERNRKNEAFLLLRV